MLERSYVLDNMKAIGILLVVIGHAKWLDDDLVKFIYAFHMPLFFFISGYLVRANYLPLFTNLMNVGKRLLVPFFFFFLISYLLWLPLHLFGAGQASQIPWYGPFIDLIYSYATSFHINGVLWFFPALIVVVLIDTLVLSRFHAVLALIVSFLISLFIVALPFDTQLIWSAGSAMVALFFYNLGKVISKYGLLPQEGIVPTYAILLVSFSGAGLLLMANSYEVKFDLRSLEFSGGYLLYYASAVLGIVLTFGISCLLFKNKITTLISVSTITIFPIHLIVFRFLNKIENIVLDYSIPHLTMVLPLINSLIAIIFCLLLHDFLTRNMPWSIGQSNMKKIYNATY